MSKGRLRAPWLVGAAGALLLFRMSAAQDIQEITAAGQKEILASLRTDAAGARKADVTIVAYFDYNCPYCKKLVPEFRSLLAQDGKVAIVYKEWPILGPVSVYAARSALAAQWQGKYLPAHDALMGAPHLKSNEQVDAVLQGAGVDMAALNRDRMSHAADINALLARSEEEADALTLKGTPGLVVGRQLADGIVDLPGLRQLVANSRRGK